MMYLIPLVPYSILNSSGSNIIIWNIQEIESFWQTDPFNDGEIWKNLWCASHWFKHLISMFSPTNGFTSSTTNLRLKQRTQGFTILSYPQEPTNMRIPRTLKMPPNIFQNRTGKTHHPNLAKEHIKSKCSQRAQKAETVSCIQTKR